MNTFQIMPSVPAGDRYLSISRHHGEVNRALAGLAFDAFKKRGTTSHLPAFIIRWTTRAEPMNWEPLRSISESRNQSGLSCLLRRSAVA